MRYLILFLVISCLYSCKEQEIGFYEGENSVAFWELYQPSTKVYSFTTPANIAKIKDTVFLDMQVSGRITDFPRKIKIKTVEGTTARIGTDFEFPAEVTLPAGAYQVKYPVIVYRTEQMKIDTMTVVVEPVETSDFKVTVTGSTPPRSTIYTEWLYLKNTVIISDILPKPTWWSDANFGVFSSVKLRYMTQITGLTDFSTNKIGGANGVISVRNTLRATLSTYESANGPLLDENNIRITF